MKRCLLTGASGFLGSYLHEALSHDFEVCTLGRKHSDITADLAKEVPTLTANFDRVVHAAGLAHTVPGTAEEEAAFFKVNAEGTARLCEALALTQFEGDFIFISTVAVYGKDQGENISETAPLEGSTPYALSKIQAEELLAKESKAQGFKLTILRLPLIIGKNAPGNLESMMKGISSGRYASIAHGEARKSMVLAQDVATLCAQPTMAQGTFNLTDRKSPSFHQLEQLISNRYGRKEPRNLPMLVAKLMGFVGDILGKRFPINSQKVKKITSNLTFNDQRAVDQLNWMPHSVVEEADEWLN